MRNELTFRTLRCLLAVAALGTHEGAGGEALPGRQGALPCSGCLSAKAPSRGRVAEKVPSHRTAAQGRAGSPSPHAALLRADLLWREQPHLRRLARSLPSQAPAQVNGLETLTGSGPRRVRVPRGRGRSRVAVSGLSPKRPEEEPPRPAREERGAAGAPRPRAVGRGPRRGARPRLRASPGRGRRGPRRRGARGEAPGLPRSPCARRRGPGPAQRGSPPRVRSVRSAAGRQAAERGRAGAPCPGVPRRRRDSRGSAGKGRMSPHFLPVNKNVTFQTVPWLGPLNPEPLGFVVVVL